MLELFTKSEIRRKIILLFLYNQRKDFYLSEIAREVSTSAGTAQRELNRLLRNDLIIFKKRGGINIYMLNKNYPLLKEVESIVTKTIGVEVELGRELKKVGNILFAFIFGSYVKGGFKSDSDIDLFVVGDVDEDQIFKAISKVEKEIHREINYHIADKQDFSVNCKKNYFHKDILKRYILLLGEEGDFKKLIK